MNVSLEEYWFSHVHAVVINKFDSKVPHEELNFDYWYLTIDLMILPDALMAHARYGSIVRGKKYFFMYNKQFGVIKSLFYFLLPEGKNISYM